MLTYLIKGGVGQKDYQVHDDVRRMMKEMDLFSLQRTLQRGDTEKGSRKHIDVFNYLMENYRDGGVRGFSEVGLSGAMFLEVLKAQLNNRG